jgi:division protein CdvB (Snf7/Vps24/ESCRT-III family)
MNNKELVADLKGLLEIAENAVRVAQTDVRMPRLLESQISEDLATIERLTARIASYRHRLENRDSILEAAKQRQSDLRKQLLLAKNHLKIERMMDLARQLNEMEE